MRVEHLSLILWEGHKLQAFENKVFTNIYGAKNDNCIIV